MTLIILLQINFIPETIKGGGSYLRPYPHAMKIGKNVEGDKVLSFPPGTDSPLPMLTHYHPGVTINDFSFINKSVLF